MAETSFRFFIISAKKAQPDFTPAVGIVCLFREYYICRVPGIVQWNLRYILLLKMVGSKTGWISGSI